MSVPVGRVAPRALVVLVESRAPDAAVSPFLDRVASRGFGGQLTLRASTRTSVSLLAQVLRVYDDLGGADVLDDGAAERNVAERTEKEEEEEEEEEGDGGVRTHVRKTVDARFPGLRLAVLSSSAACAAVARAAGATHTHVLPALAPAASAAAAASASSVSEWQARAHDLLVTSAAADVVLCHVATTAGCGDSAVFDGIAALVEGVVGGEAALDSGTIMVCVACVDLRAERHAFVAPQLAPGQPGWLPLPSAVQLDSAIVAGMSMDHPALFVAHLHHLTRKDDIKTFAERDITENGAYGAMPIDCLLAEVAYKVWKAAKYGA